jgi:toxin CptA
MSIVLGSVGFLVAAICAGLMGYAIQRGATCTVAAVDELVRKRRATRLLSMLEASLWVVGGLLIAQALGMLGTMPAGYAIGVTTVVGGILLGVGAFVNGACVFGAIARLGSGEWAYLATPIGFYAGCVSLQHAHVLPQAQKLSYGSPVLQASAWVALIVVGLMAARILAGLRATQNGDAMRSVWQRWRGGLAMRIWSPHAATTVIGITFVAMLLLVGAWAYTDVLAELARGMSKDLIARTALVLALFGGAALGGWTAGRFKSTRVRVSQLARCFVGGVMMGWGSLVIPGSNDGLILIGIPLLWPYAWLAFFTMLVSIAAAELMQSSLATSISRGTRPTGR